MNREELAEAVARGALGGMIGSMAMIPVMWLEKRVGLTRDIAPKKVAKGITWKAGAENTAHGRSADVVTAVSHLGFGAVCGAIFGGVRYAFKWPTLPLAVVFGLVVYAASYYGWIPAMEVLPESDVKNAKRSAVRAASHVLYGGILGATFDHDRRLVAPLVRQAESSVREIKSRMRAA